MGMGFTMGMGSTMYMRSTIVIGSKCKEINHCFREQNAKDDFDDDENSENCQL